MVGVYLLVLFALLLVIGYMRKLMQYREARIKELELSRRLANMVKNMPIVYFRADLLKNGNGEVTEMLVNFGNHNVKKFFKTVDKSSKPTAISQALPKASPMLIGAVNKAIDEGKKNIDLVVEIWTGDYFAIYLSIDGDSVDAFGVDISDTINYQIGLERLNDDLLKAKEEAEASERMKTEFIQNISHEIRTPLNAIVGFSEILASSCENNEESKEFTQIIRANSDLMLDLVNQIIEERDDERTSLHLEKINVTELARTSLYSLSALIADNVKLVYRCDQPEVMLTTDRYRLQQLLTNLLGNAAKFTSEGSITLELAVDEHYVTFSVIDTGCGIPKGKENSIFEEFEKGSETSTGSGLGLFICRSISNQLYGQLYVDASYTQGAKFVFQHPTMLQSMMSDQVKE